MNENEQLKAANLRIIKSRNLNAEMCAIIDILDDKAATHLLKQITFCEANIPYEPDGEIPTEAIVAFYAYLSLKSVML